jgi:mycofactocin precursor
MACRTIGRRGTAVSTEATLATEQDRASTDEVEVLEEVLVEEISIDGMCGVY